MTRIRLSAASTWMAILLSLVVALPAQASFFDFSSDYTETRYPIVLVHGLFGFDTIGPVDYFHRIPEALRDDGAEVFVAQVAAAQSTEARGEQLLREVREIIAITGAERVNLIGHSHGAPTARYVAGVRPDLVASVTSVGGPNKGSAVADVLAEVNESNEAVGGVLADIADALAGLVDELSGGDFDQDSLAALESLTTEGSAEFNRRFPAGVPAGCGDGEPVVDGVHYFSWSGASIHTNVFDLSDPLLAVTSQAFEDANDGLVSRCSAHLGRVIRDDFRQNHLDEVNQLLGMTAAFVPDPPEIYRQHANRLKRAGL